MTDTGMERVYVVHQYHDGPRSGIADYNGKPHAFECVFDETTDEYTDVFLLKPIDAKTLASALEDWKRWQGWEKRFHAGLATRGSHPSLPSDLIAALAIDRETAVRAKGTFKSSQPFRRGWLPEGVVWSTT